MCPEGHETISNFDILESLRQAFGMNGWTLIAGRAMTMFGPIEDALFAEIPHWIIDYSHCGISPLREAVAEDFNKNWADFSDLSTDMFSLNFSDHRKEK